MINEAIVLAGGLGTRLQGVISDIPKPMAPINNKPFLEYLFHYLKQFPVQKVILAVGYKYESIEACFGSSYHGIAIEYAIEKEPLGTGGAIANAVKKASGNHVFLLNGDTFFNVDLAALQEQHLKNDSSITLSLKAMTHFDRYGTVELNGTRITAFNEKKPVASGFINGGVYALKKSLLNPSRLPEKFSFEKEILEQGLSNYTMEGFISRGYFIDIGIPEDYARAQTELPQQLNF